jgi:CheY-like chemotaxis protein
VLAQTLHPDVLIADLLMPKLDGFQLPETIRQQCQAEVPYQARVFRSTSAFTSPVSQCATALGVQETAFPNSVALCFGPYKTGGAGRSL